MLASINESNIMNLLNIDNLHASIGEEKILNGFSLKINSGETHAIMGPNGSGKSTLSYVLSGKEDYNVTQGNIFLKNENIIELSADERSKLGLFLAFQYPIELPGVTGMTFLRTIINSSRVAKGLPELEGIELVKIIRKKASELNISQDMLKRFVNVGFSGGEKKRFEILQMSLLDPSIAVLDETKARKICAEKHSTLNILSTLDLMLSDPVSENLGSDLSQAIGLAVKNARMQVPKRFSQVVDEHISKLKTGLATGESVKFLLSP